MTESSGQMRPRPFEEAPSRGRLLARGFTRRCAWCGDRTAYFQGWFRRQERCRECGHQYRRGDEAFELGAVTMNIILSLLAVLITVLVLILATLPNVPVLGVTVATVVVAVVAPVLFYPVSYTLWQAVDLWMRRPSAEELAGESDGTL